MKRQLIYHSHVTTSNTAINGICVETRIAGPGNTLSFKCQLNRISRDGMTLSCNQETLNQLLPNKTGVAPKNPVYLSTGFNLNGTVEADCRVIYTRRLARDQFLLELKFSELAERDQNLIDLFIEKSLSGKNELTYSSPSLKSEEKSEDPLHNPKKPNKPSLHHLRADSKTVYSKVA